MASKVATAPRIFMVTTKGSPVHGKWLQLCNKERKKQKLHKLKAVPQYNVGLVLKKAQVTREAWYHAVNEYKAKHGDAGWMALCKQHGLHKSHSNQIKAKIVKVVMDDCAIMHHDSSPTPTPESVSSSRNHYRSHMKTTLIPYITALFKHGILDAQFNSETLLSRQVLDTAMLISHKHWSKPSGENVCRQYMTNI